MSLRMGLCTTKEARYLGEASYCPGSDLIREIFSQEHEWEESSQNNP
jgi:hypothetical protein